MIARQGDVFIVSTTATPDSIDAPADPRGLVLAEGETSGHFHAVYGDGAKLFRFRDGSGQQLLVTGKSGASVRVVGGEVNGIPRHTPVILPAGKYVIRVQRGLTSAMRSRQVQD